VNPGCRPSDLAFDVRNRAGPILARGHPAMAGGVMIESELPILSASTVDLGEQFRRAFQRSASVSEANMQVIATDICEIMILLPVRHSDERGFFSEVFKESVLQKQGVAVHFVQDNHSLSESKGVVRGLHFQIPPFAQAKLLRVTAGSVFDVAVDIRRGSPTFGRHVAVVLSATEWNQIFIPEGFAHGYCTLEPGTEVLYKVNRYYSAEHDRGLLWNDPCLGIAWPIEAGNAILSDKDRRHPVLANLPHYFQYQPPSLRMVGSAN
jgi:dTDP-4-dehydrorhamnose 3,5-epimerase